MDGSDRVRPDIIAGVIINHVKDQVVELFRKVHADLTARSRDRINYLD